VKRTGLLILLASASALVLSACLLAPRTSHESVGNPSTRGESFAIDVRVHWWQEMAIFLGNTDNGFPTPSVVALISSATCEARSGFVPPRPMIERRTKSLFVLREDLTGTQVERADGALTTGDCPNSNPIQDFRNSVLGPHLSLVLNDTPPTTIPPEQ
jgi:hypothetical protein